MKKRKLKKIYKNILVSIASIISISALLFSIITLYQARYKQVNGQRPTSIKLGK